jgi:hypothetical protein
MRGVRWRVQWYARVWSEAKKGLSLANPDTIHGSLLTIQELLRIDDDFMIARYKEVSPFPTLIFYAEPSVGLRYHALIPQPSHHRRA